MGLQKFIPTVNFRTWVRNVVMLTEATEEEPRMFSCSVKPIDLNEAGATEPILEDYLLIDYIGHIYEITAVNSLILTVSDVFRTGTCPQNCQQGVIVKKAWSGRALIISPVITSHLHHSAKAYIDSLNWDILWSNDSNGKKILFENSNTPSVEDYQLDRVDEEGRTINYYQDYGDHPECTLVQITVDELTGDDIWSYRTEKQTNVMVDGKITRIHFGELPDPITGFILISRK